MPASPIHASFPEHNNTRARDGQHGQHSPVPPSSRPSPGSRQTRRLQLRNAGFRGPQITTTDNRGMTPSHSMPTMSTSSSHWSSAQSDAENVSPSGMRAGNPKTSVNMHDMSAAGGILQDIGNSATLAQSNARPRATPSANKFWAVDNNSHSKHDSLFSDDLCSPPPQPPSSGPQPGSLRRRSIRTRAKVTRPRRSVSGETRMYVEHLETQLADAQSQLSAVNSPTVTREQSARMRHLNAETKSLQEEIVEWEAKYEERIQEEMAQYYQAEASLRSRIRSLEQEAEETKFQVLDLESQLETTTQDMDAVEAANVNLEKRLEIMSELLAASPNKIDLHAQTPGRARHGRPASTVMPRFPTASSLAASPERTNHASPSSPTSSHLRWSSRRVPASLSQINFSPEVTSEDDEVSTNSDMNSVIVGPAMSKKAKPARRMRRFRAGSMGPKPLILPSTSHCEQIAMTAPALDRGESGSVFPFSPHLEGTDDDSPSGNRRRSSSEAAKPLVLRLSASPLMSFKTADDSEDGEPERRNMPRMSSPPSRWSTAEIKRPSSMGSAFGDAVGRNLLEELKAAEDSRSDYNENTDTEFDQIPHSSPFNSDAENERPPSLQEQHQDSLNKAISGGPGTRLISNASTATALPFGSRVVHLPPIKSPSLHTRARSSSRSLSAKSHSSTSTFESLRTVFSGLFRSPLELAKHLVQTAQSRMRIPRPLLNVQWWLVGILLGPMARRRILGRTSCCGESPKKSNSSEQQSLLDEPIPQPESTVAYTSITAVYQTPMSVGSSSSALVASPVRARSLVAGKGKKRASGCDSPALAATVSSPTEKCDCPRRSRRWKHSPLLWLKFSMTLAIAVGVAFKDGPACLLKEAVCLCGSTGAAQRGHGGRHGRKGSRSSGAGVGNWRKARRD